MAGARPSAAPANLVRLQMHEVELKFLLDEPAGDVWARAKKLGPGGKRRTRTLRSIYFDTDDHALKKAGTALRLRRDGRRWVQTVKTNRLPGVGLTRVGEVENDAPGGRLAIGAIPDQAVRDAVLRQVAGRPLEPVCETVIRRATKEISTVNGTVAELAVDVGTVLAAGRAAELREVEIELLAGDPRGLFEIAQALFPSGGLRLSRLSKSERGYLLAETGGIEPDLAPRNARRVELETTLTAEEGARRILRECIEQVVDNIEVVRSLDQPEGPHQLRIGLRRLRSLFGMFMPVAKSAELKRLDGEARWLAREVGALRDLDVAGGDILEKEAGAHVEEPCLAMLAARVEALAAERREEIRALLSGPRVQTLLLDLICCVETRGWLVPEEVEQTARLAAPIGELAQSSLDRQWKRVAKRARKIDRLGVEQRHDLRKELKKLRYAIEFFTPLYERKRTAPMIKRLKRLQEVFGALNDAAMLHSVLDQPGLMDSDDASAQRAAGWVLGASEARAALAWTGAKAQWRALKQTKPFWR
jgi:inorganic triphosphatase YgiF